MDTNTCCILCKYFVYCSAIIEHTNQVIFLEDDDVAAVMNGCLTIHRLKRNFDDPNESTVREVISLQMEIQQIMKGTYRIKCVHFNIQIFNKWYCCKRDVYLENETILKM